MATYRPTTTFALVSGNTDEDKQIVDLLNEYASLLDMPVNMAGRRLLRDVLPDRIAGEKRKSK